MKKIPVRAYQKISPFDSVKFGVSSRVYIYRCPEYEAAEKDGEEEEENVFLQTLA